VAEVAPEVVFSAQFSGKVYSRSRGVGRVEMVALGAILLLTLTDAMDLLRIDPRIQAIFLGIIVVFAVALDELSQRRAALAAIFLDRIRRTPEVNISKLGFANTRGILQHRCKHGLKIARRA
jgi:hypothetical protein